MLLLAIVALEVPLALSVRRRVDDEVRSQARAQAEVLAATSADLLATPLRAKLQALVTASGDTVRGRVLVVDAGGRALADSAGTRLIGSPYGGRPEVGAALGGHAVQRTRHSRTLGEDLLATAVPIRSGTGPPVGAVRITQSIAAVQRAVRTTMLGLALIGAVVLAVGLIAGLVIAATVARPLGRLGATARRVATGDLSARADLEGSSEQRALAIAFNEMTDRVTRLLRGQQDFVADASHQLRTPLTALRLRLEEARVAAGDPVAVVAEVDAGIAELDRLAAVIDELLVLSRAGERELPGEQVDLGAAVRRAADRWTAAAGEQHQSISADGEGATWCAAADLDRILDALVENALGYSPAGGAVHLTASPSGVDVLDDGPGPEPGEEEAVFQRFHRGRSGRAGPPGTGLGLAIARELAREWGGDVVLRARPQGGARATISLPPVVRRAARPGLRDAA